MSLKGITQPKTNAAGETIRGGYTEFERGGRKFYRYGTYEIEADKVKHNTHSASGGPRDSEAPPPDDLVTEVDIDDLNRQATKRAQAAGSAAALGLTTGSQTGYMGKTQRTGRSYSTGGGYAGSRALSGGRPGSALLGGYL